MKLKINNTIITLVKDKTLFQNDFRKIMEEPKTGFVYDDNRAGVIIIPHRIAGNGKEILIRDEWTPLRTTCLSLISGRRDEEESGSNWWKETARRELREEAGIEAEARWFFDIGELFSDKGQKNNDVLVVVDVTGLKQAEPKTDGTVFEAKSKNIWINVNDLLSMVRIPRDDMDTYLLAGITKFLTWCGMIRKSEESDLLKAQIGKPSSQKGKERPGHKYIRRTPLPGGGYRYIYEELKGRKKGVPEPSKTKKPTLAETIASLIKKPQSESKEKAPKPLEPLDAFREIPKDIPDFNSKMTAERYFGLITDRAEISIRQLMSDSLKENADFNPIEAFREFDYTLMVGVENNILDVDKKTDAGLRLEMRNAFDTLSRGLSVVEQSIALMNHSSIEKLDYFTTNRLISELETSQRIVSDTIRDVKWLKYQDERIDYMIERMHDRMEDLMKQRDSFVEQRYVELTQRLMTDLSNITDSNGVRIAIHSTDMLSSMIKNSIYSSINSRDSEFTNQWNLKPKGMYQTSMRLLAHATNEVVSQFKTMYEINPESSKEMFHDISGAESFYFMTMDSSQDSSPNHISEQTFAFINKFGLEQYYQSAMYMLGTKIDIVREGSIKNKSSIFLTILDEIRRGTDIYNDEETLFISEGLDKKLGDMTAIGSEGTFYSVMNSMILCEEMQPELSKIPAFTRLWSSLSHGSVATAIIEEFATARGIDKESYVNYHVASNRAVIPTRSAIRDSLLSSAEAVYKQSQRNIEEDHPKGNAILYRGNGNAEVKSAASSWSSKSKIAAGFGDVLMKADVPNAAIFLYQHPAIQDYFSYPEEKEYVVIPGLLPANNQLIASRLSEKERASAAISKSYDYGDKFGADEE